MEEAQAILLKRYRFSENSLVVVWLTDRHGKVKTVVRGACKQGSPFAGRLELFTRAEITFKAPGSKKGGDLHTLGEVVVSVGSPLPPTYPTILTASYFSELCDLFTETMHPVPEIFELLRRAWGFLETRAPDRRALEHFETELARVLGIHDPSRPAYRSLAAVAHSLPANRIRLMEVLPG
jgi:DNA repair protein RecO (recombination protein O)